MTISISINKLGKKFNREWIFRNLNCDIAAGEKLLVSGGNGSGKSTLLQVISGFVTPNEGGISYTTANGAIPSDKLRNYISFASPYLHLIEELTLLELIEHTAVYKPFANGLKANNIIDRIELAHGKNKPIRQFSSGMKQRVKLGLAILADTPLLLLDEPVSNLDKNAIDWYKNLMKQNSLDRTVIVCSNAISDEHFFCDREINVMDFKVGSR